MPRPLSDEIGDEVGALPQPALQLGPDLLDRDLGDIPLREHDQRRAMRLARDVDGGDVALDDPLRSRRSGRARRRRARPPRARAAPSSTRCPAAACACGAGRPCRRGRTFARRARSRCRSCHASCPASPRRSCAPRRRAVEERRLADVRPAEDRDADRLVARPLPAPSPRQQRHDLVEQVADVRAVQAGDRERVAEAEAVELERERLLRRVVDLVREHEHGLAATRAGSAPAPRRPGVTPARASTTNSTRSASSIAARACSAICRVIGFVSTMSTPPVSISRNSVPFHSHDELLAVARRAAACRARPRRASR